MDRLLHPCPCCHLTDSVYEKYSHWWVALICRNPACSFEGVRANVDERAKVIRIHYDLIVGSNPVLLRQRGGKHVWKRWAQGGYLPPFTDLDGHIRFTGDMMCWGCKKSPKDDGSNWMEACPKAKEAV